MQVPFSWNAFPLFHPSHPLTQPVQHVVHVPRNLRKGQLLQLLIQMHPDKQFQQFHHGWIWMISPSSKFLKWLCFVQIQFFHLWFLIRQLQLQIMHSRLGMGLQKTSNNYCLQPVLSLLCRVLTCFAYTGMVGKPFINCNIFECQIKKTESPKQISGTATSNSPPSFPIVFRIFTKIPPSSKSCPSQHLSYLLHCKTGSILCRHGFESPLFQWHVDRVPQRRWSHWNDLHRYW